MLICNNVSLGTQIIRVIISVHVEGGLLACGIAWHYELSRCLLRGQYEGIRGAFLNIILISYDWWILQAWELINFMVSDPN